MTCLTFVDVLNESPHQAKVNITVEDIDTEWRPSAVILLPAVTLLKKLMVNTTDNLGLNKGNLLDCKYKVRVSYSGAIYLIRDETLLEKAIIRLL